MAAAPRPRPNKNSDGQNKPSSMTHTITSVPAPPAPVHVQAPPPPPGRPGPGQTNPMTHPAHPMMQSSLGQPPGAASPSAAAGGVKQSQTLPEAGNPNPTGNPLGNLTPTPTQDQRQVREQIQFKDMNPVEQAQTAEQQGLDPYAPLKMVQQGVVGALQSGPSTGPIPNELAGPYVPPGIEAFPDDFAHLSTLMAQGFAPGASGQEHEFAQNASALARAKINQAMSQSQNGVGMEQAAPYGPQQAPPTGPTPNVGFAPGIPEQAGPSAPGGAAGPQLSSSMQGPPPGAGAPPAGPPTMPPAAGGLPPAPGGAPGGIPPALIAAIMAQHKRSGALR